MLNILKNLKEYYTEFTALKYLFEGSKGGKYSVTSILKIIDSAAIKLALLRKSLLIYEDIALQHIFWKTERT